MKGAIFRLMERDAVEAAKGGNFRLLADMLHPKPKNPLLGQDRPPLKPETMELVCLRLVGEYKAPRRGPPKASPAQRSANTKSYDAANEMQLIELLLWRHYRGEKGIRRRAIEIAAERAGIDANTLWNYLKKNPRPSLFYK
jgi:hypothetical protein